MSPTVSRPSSRPTVAGLLVLVVALALLQAGQPLHTHRDASAGVYNEEHVLASLDSVSGDVPLPSPIRAISAQLPVGPPVPVAPADAPSPVARHADSRAPPITL